MRLSYGGNKEKSQLWTTNKRNSASVYVEQRNYGEPLPTIVVVVTIVQTWFRQKHKLCDYHRLSMLLHVYFKTLLKQFLVICMELRFRIR